MRALTHLMLTFVLGFFIVSCGHDDPDYSGTRYYPSSSSSPLPSNSPDARGWTAEYVNKQIDTCVNSATAGSSAYAKQIDIFRKGCTCVFQAIQKKWTYEYYNTNQSYIIDTVVNDGTYSECFKSANTI